jgi:hypothetical protein
MEEKHSFVESRLCLFFPADLKVDFAQVIFGSRTRFLAICKTKGSEEHYGKMWTTEVHYVWVEVFKYIEYVGISRIQRA